MDFISDAFAHCKFIGYSAQTQPLFEAAGVAEKMDSGFVLLHAEKDASRFIKTCRDLRFWDREAGVDADMQE
jgi:catalase